MNINQGRLTFLERNADAPVEVYEDKECTKLYQLTTVGELMSCNDWDESVQEAVLLALLNEGEAFLAGGGAAPEFWNVCPKRYIKK